MLKHNKASMRLVRFIRKSAILRNKEISGYYQNIFDKCDTDKDGYISLSELKEFITDLEENEIPEEVVQGVLSRFDKNKDERLDFQEFLELINNPTVLRTFKRIGSCYIRYVGLSSVREKSLKLKRTVTNTGMYEEEFAIKKYTICMILISILQIILFYVNKMSDDQHIRDTLEFHPKKRREVWRYITYILMHKDAVHLYGNLLVQILIGFPLEVVHSWRVPIIYLIGSLGACMTHALTEPRAILSGASGGVYAFYTAHIAAVVMNWREMTHPCVHLIIFGIMTGFDAIYNYVWRSTTEMTISYITHLAGAVIGFLMGVIILKNLVVTTIEVVLQYLALALLVLAMIVLIVLNCVI